MSTTFQTSATAPVQLTTSQSLPTTRDNLPAWPSAVPTGSPNPSASSDPSSGQSTGPVSYYFVLFALVFCIVAFAVVMYWRRRRLMMGRSSRPHILSTRGAAAPTQRLPRHVGIEGPTRLSQEEGLNEHGEAPPPYASKAHGEPVQQHTDVADHHDSADPAAIPLQTLSRSTAGPEPPHYVPPDSDGTPGSPNQS